MLNDGTWSLTWDAENRMTKAERTGRDKAEFTYDYMSRRVTKAVYLWTNGAWALAANLKFVYDGWNLIETLDGNESNNITWTYVWGKDLSGTMQDAGGVGGLLSAKDSSGTYYPCYDANGNIGVYLDSTGAKVACYDYNPFAKLISSNGSKANDFAFRFSTKYYDNETGLYYYGYRYYSPDLGRWINRDPIGEEGGKNLYNFVGNNGISKWDILGNEIDGPFTIGNYAYFHVYENVYFWQFWKEPKYLGSIRIQLYPNSTIQDNEAGIEIGRSAAQQIQNKSDLGNLANTIATGGKCTEIAVRLAYSPIDFVASTGEVIDEPSWINLAAMLPFVGALGKVAKITEKIERKVAVLGHYPDYLTMAAQIDGAKRFSMPTSVWNKMSPVEQWAANQKFLDRLIARGDIVYLATPLDKVKTGTWFDKELKYLFEKGYQVSEDGKTLIPKR